MARVRLENLTIRYGKTVAVQNVELTVEDGEYWVLLGPSGCGKTSLLRTIAGLVQPSEGEVYIGDQRVTHLYPGDRGVAMVFQNYALYPHHTVYGNLAFPLRAAKVPHAEIQQRVEQVATRLHLQELLHRYPRELSGGQQQRVAVGRALIRRPDVLLLDEPLGNLDAALRIEMREMLRELQREWGVTTVHVTHDQLEAQAVGDRIVVMDMGHIRQIGTPQEIYSQPADLFVATFIGTPTLNLLPVTVTFQRPSKSSAPLSSHPWLQSEGFLVEPSPRWHSLLKEGKRYLLGIRPEHLNIGAPATLTAEVVLVEPQGSEWILKLRKEKLILHLRKGRDALPHPPKVGEQVPLQLNLTNAHLFDPETGKRLGTTTG